MEKRKVILDSCQHLCGQLDWITSFGFLAFYLSVPLSASTVTSALATASCANVVTAVKLPTVLVYLLLHVQQSGDVCYQRQSERYRLTASQ